MKIFSNKARCRKCGDVIESKSVHDFKTCSCGAIQIDGGLEYLKRGAVNIEDLEELSEYELEDSTQKQQKEDPGKALEYAKYCLDNFRQDAADPNAELAELASDYAKAARQIKQGFGSGDEVSKFWMERSKAKGSHPKDRIYLAGMYSDPNPDVRRRRLNRLSAAAGLLLKQDCIVFSPISHSAHIVEEMEGLPQGPDFWLRQCDTYLRDWATKLLVLPNEDWWTSYGVRHEIQLARALDIPVEIAFPLMDAVLMHEEGTLLAGFLLKNRLDTGKPFC